MLRQRLEIVIPIVTVNEISSTQMGAGAHMHAIFLVHLMLVVYHCIWLSFIISSHVVYGVAY